MPEAIPPGSKPEPSIIWGKIPVTAQRGARGNLLSAEDAEALRVKLGFIHSADAEASAAQNTKQAFKTRLKAFKKFFTESFDQVIACQNLEDDKGIPPGQESLVLTAIDFMARKIEERLDREPALVKSFGILLMDAYTEVQPNDKTEASSIRELKSELFTRLIWRLIGTGADDLFTPLIKKGSNERTRKLISDTKDLKLLPRETLPNLLEAYIENEAFISGEVEDRNFISNLVDIYSLESGREVLTETQKLFKELVSRFEDSLTVLARIEETRSVINEITACLKFMNSLLSYGLNTGDLREEDIKTAFDMWSYDLENFDSIMTCASLDPDITIDPEEFREFLDLAQVFAESSSRGKEPVIEGVEDFIQSSLPFFDLRAPELIDDAMSSLNELDSERATALAIDSVKSTEEFLLSDDALRVMIPYAVRDNVFFDYLVKDIKDSSGGSLCLLTMFQNASEMIESKIKAEKKEIKKRMKSELKTQKEGRAVANVTRVLGQPSLKLAAKTKLKVDPPYITYAPLRKLFVRNDLSIQDVLDSLDEIMSRDEEYSVGESLDLIASQFDFDGEDRMHSDILENKLAKFLIENKQEFNLKTLPENGRCARFIEHCQSLNPA